MQVRLIRHLAKFIDGIDLSNGRVGDLIELSPRDAAMLVAEGWAVALPIERRGDRRRAPADAIIGAPQKRRP